MYHMGEGIPNRGIIRCTALGVWECESQSEEEGGSLCSQERSEDGRTLVMTSEAMSRRVL